MTRFKLWELDGSEHFLNILGFCFITGMGLAYLGWYAGVHAVFLIFILAVIGGSGAWFLYKKLLKDYTPDIEYFENDPGKLPERVRWLLIYEELQMLRDGKTEKLAEQMQRKAVTHQRALTLIGFFIFITGAATTLILYTFYGEFRIWIGVGILVIMAGPLVMAEARLTKFQMFRTAEALIKTGRTH